MFQVEQVKVFIIAEAKYFSHWFKNWCYKKPQPQLTTPGTPTGASRLNTLGARVTGSTLTEIPRTRTLTPPTIACMVPFLSVSETTPVTSQIEIFYESSTSDNFVDLYKKL